MLSNDTKQRRRKQESEERHGNAHSSPQEEQGFISPSQHCNGGQRNEGADDHDHQKPKLHEGVMKQRACSQDPRKTTGLSARGAMRRLGIVDAQRETLAPAEWSLFVICGLFVPATTLRLRLDRTSC